MESWEDQVRFALSKYEIGDQISSLPDHIIHLILDHLPLKDAARMSVLSNNWKSFLSGYPILRLHLDHNLFGLQFLLAAESELESNIHEIRERFMDFVDDRLSKVIQKSTRVQKLALNVAVNDSKCFPRVDRLMELVIKLKQVEELCLFVQTNDSKWEDEIEEGDVFYSVPFSVLGSKGLCSLHIRGCNFASLSQNNFSSTMVGACSSLRQLSLLHAVFDEQAVVNVARCCPGIEVLEFEYCNFWVGFLVLSVFPRLKKASFLDNLGWRETITVDNISLESFTSNSCATFEFIAAACGNVKELILDQTPDELCVDLTRTFPILEEADLAFSTCCLETFKAANHHHLRKLSCSFSHILYQVKEDLCEKLVAKPHCEEFCNKCWWHHLEDFEIENLVRTEINKNWGQTDFGIENSIRTEVNKKDLADFIEMDRPYPKKSCFKFFWSSNQVRSAPLEQ